MSISRGRYVATFCRPGEKFTGEKTKFRDNSWVGLDYVDILPVAYRFPTFEEAKAWAIQRLNELIRSDNEHQ